MPRCTLKLGEDMYLEWSTVVDAPITFIQGRKEHAEYLLAEYGNSYKDEIEPRLERADKNGASWQMGGRNLEGTIAGNRAGIKEKNLSLKQLIKVYSSAKAYNKFFGK